MAFNKNKALENALKYLNQGKPAQAIGEYQQILRHDPKDQATLMTVGDLFARQGDMPQAIEYFERLAQVYLSDGFNSKAIAIYKKIAKLAPNELPPLERLADLYVQQGVLSEARPLFLQIAEAHLKANRAAKAVEVLQRLLDVEPDNPRVQMRLAELYNVMGQKKEAAHTYFAYAQRLHERGENDEALKLIDRALDVEHGNADAQLLKAKILTAAHRPDQAIAILEKHPDADAGSDVTNMLVELELANGHFDKAADRARNQLVRGSSHFGLLQKVADSMIEGGHAVQAIPVLRELRDPMIEASEQDKYLKSLSEIAEKLPKNPEPLEMMADFSRSASDPFHLNAALSKLVDVYADGRNFSRAEELMQELIDRNKGDERLVTRLDELRARANGTARPSAAAPQPEVESLEELDAPAKPVVELRAEAEEETAAEEGAPAATTKAIGEESLDEETQKYVAQALTDVDLFSSYGLTHKATHLLESVLERAPRHTPTLERLLDFYLGAGDDRRTAEMAAQLEQIYRDAGDTANADRFAELRERYQKVAGMSDEELKPAPAAPSATPAVSQAPVESPVESPAPKRGQAAPAPAEFEIPLGSVEPEETTEDASAKAAAAKPVEAKASPEPVKKVVAAKPAEPQPMPAEEVDLSDEWEAMVQDVEAPAKEAAPEPTDEVETASAKDEVIEIIPDVETEAEIPQPPPEPQPEPQQTIQLTGEPAEEMVAAQPEASEVREFELDLTQEPAPAETKAGAQTTEDFLNELAAEVDDMETPTPVAAAPKEPSAPKRAAPAPPVPVAQTPVPVAAEATAETTAASLNQLAEVFQEFRSELGEIADEDEDLETHYNLGIAYREMGLLDEAIGEFQKVAKAVQKGKPFPYAMNCSTLLALTFMDKGEPKIAALWYKRALEIPGLDQETVLALRYDLGVSLETAGESTSALDSFRQVYAMNIDYRDVADRIAILQKH